MDTKTASEFSELGIFVVWDKEPLISFTCQLDIYTSFSPIVITWHRRISTLLTPCEGNPPFTGGFPLTKGQECGCLMLPLLLIWTSGWIDSVSATVLRGVYAHLTSLQCCMIEVRKPLFCWHLMMHNASAVFNIVWGWHISDVHHFLRVGHGI